MALSLFEIICFNSSEKLFKLVIKRAVRSQHTDKNSLTDTEGDMGEEELLCFPIVSSA